MDCTFFPINLLHDIALIIEKYTCEIDWDTILKRVEKLNALDELLLIANMINTVYQNPIPQYVLDYCEKSIKDCQNDFMMYKKFSMFYPLTLANKVDAGEILRSHIDILAEKVVGSIEHIGIDIDCFYQQTTSFVIRSSDRSKKLILGSILDNKEDDCSPKIIAKGDMTWDLKNLIIKLSLNGMENRQKDLNILFYLCTQQINKSTQCYLNKISLNYSIQHQKRYGDVYLKNAFVTIEEYNFEQCTIKYENDQYNLDINMPWDIIGITPYDGLEIFFDIEILQNYEKKPSGNPFVINKFGDKDIGSRGLGNVFTYSPELLNKVKLVKGMQRSVDNLG